MRIALIVDNPFRDLPGNVLLATRLSQEGSTCYLVPLNLAAHELSALAPDFVLITSLRRPRQRFTQQLLDAGIQVGVLDAEGGVIPSLDMYRRLTNPDPDLYDHVRCFCSWGPKIANYVINEGWYDPAQVEVTGSPRFDFYSPRWRDVALKISPVNGDSNRPLILINGSFPRANPVILTRERELQSWVANGFDPEYVRNHQDVEYQALLGMTEVANHIAERFPQVDVVYRPHPFEKLDTYTSLLKPLNNLRLVKAGSVEGWILRASAVIQHHCTTAIEAGMAGKPAFLPDWLPTAQRIESTESVSIKCASQSELDEWLIEVLDGKSDPTRLVAEPLKQVLGDWFHTIDGSAHCRAASAIRSHVDANAVTPNISKCRKIHYGWGQPGRTMQARVGAAFRIGLGLPVSWSNRRLSDVKDWNHWWDQSAKHFDVDAVRRVTNAIGPLASPIVVRAAIEKRDYRLHYTVGRSVVLSAT